MRDLHRILADTQAALQAPLKQSLVNGILELAPILGDGLSLPGGARALVARMDNDQLSQVMSGVTHDLVLPLMIHERYPGEEEGVRSVVLEANGPGRGNLWIARTDPATGRSHTSLSERMTMGLRDVEFLTNLFERLRALVGIRVELNDQICETLKKAPVVANLTTEETALVEEQIREITEYTNKARAASRKTAEAVIKARHRNTEFPKAQSRIR